MTANLTTRLGQLTSSPAGGPYTGANKIINGDMRIDQRNAGAAVTATAALIYGGDRWFSNASITSKFSVQSQVASPSPVAGVPATCVKILSLAATTPGAGDYYEFGQRVEGLNCTDLQWGTAVAAAVTMSFWVYSSLTGTFGGTIANSAGNRSYPFNYTVGSANTWTKISVAITGDTTGTWLTTNGTFMQVILNMGAGSTYGTGTASTWAGSLILQPTGSTNFVATNAAAMYVTAIKLEVGTIATPFVPDDYQVSLAKCQRYYYRWTAVNAALVDMIGQFQAWQSARWQGKLLDFPPMRASPTFGISGVGDFSIYNANGTVTYPMTSLGTVTSTPTNVALQGPTASTAVLVVGNSTTMVATSTGVWYDLSAEL